MRGYVSCVVGCPYEGPVPPSQVTILLFVTFVTFLTVRGVKGGAGPQGWQDSNSMVSVGLLHPTFTSCCSLVVRVLCSKPQGPGFKSHQPVGFSQTQPGTQFPCRFSVGKIVGRKAPLTLCCVHCSHNLFSYFFLSAFFSPHKKPTQRPLGWQSMNIILHSRRSFLGGHGC